MFPDLFHVASAATFLCTATDYVTAKMWCYLGAHCPRASRPCEVLPKGEIEVLFGQRGVGSAKMLFMKSCLNMYAFGDRSSASIYPVSSSAGNSAVRFRDLLGRKTTALYANPQDLWELEPMCY